jgi:hypothetical protein
MECCALLAEADMIGQGRLPRLPARRQAARVTVERENASCGQFLMLFAFQRGVRTEISCSASSMVAFASLCTVGRTVKYRDKGENIANVVLSLLACSV